MEAIYKRKSTPASQKIIFPQEQTYQFVIRPVKQNQLSFSSIEINKTLPALVHSVI